MISCDSFTMRLKSLSLIFSDLRRALSAKSSINNCIADFVLATVAIRTFALVGEKETAKVYLNSDIYAMPFRARPEPLHTIIAAADRLTSAHTES